MAKKAIPFPVSWQSDKEQLIGRTAHRSYYCRIYPVVIDASFDAIPDRNVCPFCIGEGHFISTIKEYIYCPYCTPWAYGEIFDLSCFADLVEIWQIK
jgi:hypothetical protein